MLRATRAIRFYIAGLRRRRRQDRTAVGDALTRCATGVRLIVRRERLEQPTTKIRARTPGGTKNKMACPIRSGGFSRSGAPGNDRVVTSPVAASATRCAGERPKLVTPQFPALGWSRRLTAMSVDPWVSVPWGVLWRSCGSVTGKAGKSARAGDAIAQRRCRRTVPESPGIGKTAAVG